jgi:hypothetical protein
MTGAEIIALANKRGVTLETFFDRLRVYSEGDPDESLVRLLRDNKPAVMDAILAAETPAGRWRRLFAEKVDTLMQFLGLPRPEAEREASRHIVTEYSNKTHPNTDPNRCAGCGKPETPGATLLPIGWGERHAWLHSLCVESWHQKRREQAVARLAVMGIVEPGAGATP